jgi:hypothetical protein
MWLVANDIIIGLAIGSFLMNNNVAMANMLHRILHVSFCIISIYKKEKCFKHWRIEIHC